MTHVLETKKLIKYLLCLSSVITKALWKCTLGEIPLEVHSAKKPRGGAHWGKALWKCTVGKSTVEVHSVEVVKMCILFSAKLYTAPLIFIKLSVHARGLSAIITP